MTTKQELLKEKEKLEQVIKDLESKIEAMPDDKKKVIPEKGKDYYLIGESGSSTISMWLNDNLDKGRLAIGNVFLTRAEAERHITNLKIHQRLKELADGYEFVAGEENKYFVWEVKSGKVDHDWYYSYKNPSTVYFHKDVSMEDVARQMQEEFGDDWIEYVEGGL